jgi:uncharacterized protein
MSSALDQLLRTIAEEERRLPPVDKWQPPLSGDIDIRIAANGDWYHEGGLIRRHELVKLFSSILRREGSDYFLVTPVEKWRIQVDDLPFVAHTVDRVAQQGSEVLVFTTNVDACVVAGPDHPVEVLEDPHSGAPQPAILIRPGLQARIGRTAFYRMADWARAEADGWWLDSGDYRICLGSQG